MELDAYRTMAAAPLPFVSLLPGLSKDAAAEAAPLKPSRLAA